MDCKAVQKAIYRFVYGEGDSTELLHVKTHLDRCRECESERVLITDILAKIQAAAAQDTSETMPSGLRERLLGKIHQSIEVEDNTH